MQVLPDHVQSFLLRASDWAYLGEGASNVVVAYSGDHSSLVGTVLRLRKRLEAKPGPSFPADADLLVWGEALGVGGEAPREEWQWQYTRRVIAPLIGRRFVHAGHLVPITPAFVESLSRLLAPLRPAHRAAHPLDPSGGFALLLPNCSSPQRTRALSGASASASTTTPASDQRPQSRPPRFLSVEIKPKCGFLPASDAVCPVGGALKRASSRFQLHQHLKVASGKYSKRSDYCPLELFSGHGGRLRGALRRLLEHPQNNLALRGEGGWAYPGPPGSGPAGAPLRALRRRLRAFLFSDAATTAANGGDDWRSSDAAAGQAAEAEAEDALVELVARALEETGVLDAVIAAQRLDEHDVDGAIEVYCSLFGADAEVAEALQASASTHAATAEARAALRRLPKEDALRLLREFLVALSAKDCSILICFAPVEEETALPAAAEGEAAAAPRCYTTDGAQRSGDGCDGDGAAAGAVCRVALRGREFYCRMAVVDTDIRPVERIPKYYLEEKKILHAASAAAAASPAAGC